jgi:xanthine dehydrogenase accessory factor
MKLLCDEVIRLLESGESFIQATILQSNDSTPRGEGASMLIRSEGRTFETVGGGALEGGIISAAPEVFRSKRAQIVEVLLDGNDAAAPGVICGGAAIVLIDHIDAGHPGNLEFFSALRTTLRSGQRARILTVAPVSGGGDGAVRHQCLLMQDGELFGIAGLSPDVLKAIGSRSGSYDTFTKLDSFEVYMLSVGTDGTAYIFGAGHCGEKLAPVLATVGFGTVIIDDRTEFANAERFPMVDQILVPDTMDQPFNDMEMGDDSYIVIVTRGHAHDELVLRCALRTSAGYIGMIGSKRKRESIYDNMLADGFKQSDIDRVFSPIGMDIGAETPEEIAISIAAEMVKLRAQRRDAG